MRSIQVLILASALLVSTFTYACPNWQALVKEEKPANWDGQLNPQDISVISDPVNKASPVTKLTIGAKSAWPNGHTRVELKHNGCSTHEGEKTYLSWEFYLEEPIHTLNDIAYWESDKSYMQSMGFYLQPEQNGFSQLSFFTSLPKRKVHWQQVIAEKQWHKVSMAITWSESAKKGKVSVWFNDLQVAKNLGVKTKPDANKLFIQLGLHRNQAESAIDSIYLKNVREVDSESELTQ